MIYWPSKAPADIVDVGADWTPTLAKLGTQTIVGQNWVRLQGDANIIASTIEVGAKGTKARVSGGTVGTETVWRNYVSLNDGQTLHEDAYMKVV